MEASTHAMRKTVQAPVPALVRMEPLILLDASRSTFLGRVGDERRKMLLQLCAAAGRTLHLALFVLLQRHDDQRFFAAIKQV